MSIYPVEFSIVVVGRDCNPTILNPDFLAHRKIVNPVWGWEMDAPPITTPPIAAVRYDSGVRITVEPSRLLVTDVGFGGDVVANKIPTIAKAYVRALPHVRYTAVGINFRSLVEMDDPDGYLKERFLRPRVGDGRKRILDTLKLTLGYAHQDGIFNLSLERAAVVREAGGKSTQVHGVLAAANYHREWKEYPGDKKAITAIGRVRHDARHFENTLKELFVDLDTGSTA